LLKDSFITYYKKLFATSGSLFFLIALIYGEKA